MVVKLSKEERRKLGEKVFCATSRLARLRAASRNPIRTHALTDIVAEEFIMEANDNGTVVDKAVNFVKDVFGVQHDPVPEVPAKPAFEDTEPEETAEAAMSLDPNAYVVNSAGQVTPGLPINPMGESETERLRREADEHPREKTAAELRAESAFHEDNG